MKMDKRYVCLLYLTALFIGISAKSRHRITGETLLSVKPSLKLEPRIVNGEDAIAHSYPWQAALVSEEEEEGDQEKIMFCGGSLIDKHYVLTAAHCVAGVTKDEATVILGDHLLNEEEGVEQVRHVSKIIRSPVYKNCTMDKDYALLKLDKPAILNEYVNVIPLGKEFVSSGDCIVTGWGTEDENGSVNNILEEATVDVLPQDICQYVWSNVIDILPSMLCAGTGISGSCSGDSGGPLICRDNGEWFLAGITSWGAECGLMGVPDVYTRVSAIYDEIKAVIDGKNNNNV
ncbi:chymotrypsinogen A-like [Saccoglossus kowalevskii]|uniref:Chymotrypsin A-like n=1 Tax=Saccoglossus kowalevskii TaxID=10224 RepID=A0ABM0GPT7_SACKO|nr:PREDICTED: chymotrypsin A-like [Saccoglossus kowalevskii]